MKKLIIISILLLSTSFSQQKLEEKIVNIEDLIRRGDIFYIINPYQPYTGKVLEINNNFTKKYLFLLLI